MTEFKPLCRHLYRVRLGYTIRSDDEQGIGIVETSDHRYETHVATMAPLGAEALQDAGHLAITAHLGPNTPDIVTKYLPILESVEYLGTVFCWPEYPGERPGQ